MDVVARVQIHVAAAVVERGQRVCAQDGVNGRRPVEPHATEC